ncbi:MAG: phage tail family protein [Clostridia bacterium]|nr:phage tail family protein [Clostridia bacterium]
MERFTFVNGKGQGVVIGGHQDDYLLVSHKGTTSAEVLTTARKGYNQNGRHYVKANLGVRILTLTFYTHRQTDLAFYEKKRNLSALFNPLLGEGVLTYENDYTKKCITVAVTGMPELAEKSKILGKYTVELTAHAPFWYDEQETEIRLNGVTGGLTFPVQFTGAGVQFALKGARATVTIDSDVDVPITMEFSGPCENPVFANTSIGKKIAIKTTVSESEKIIVTTGYGNKNIYKVAKNGTRTNVNNLITNETEFFSLRPGTNALTFDADTGTPEIDIRYRNLFTGV